MTDPILIGWHFLRSDGCLRDGSTLKEEQP